MVVTGLVLVLVSLSTVWVLGVVGAVMDGMGPVDGDRGGSQAVGEPGLAQLTTGRLVDRDQPCHTYPPRGDAAATTVRARQSLVLFSRLSLPHPADPTDTVTAQRSCYRYFMPSHVAGRRGSSPSTYARIGTCL